MSFCPHCGSPIKAAVVESSNRCEHRDQGFGTPACGESPTVLSGDRYLCKTHAPGIFEKVKKKR